MAGLRNIFLPEASTRPALACEIRTEGVAAARTSTEKRGHSETVVAWAPLPESALLPSLKTPNVLDRPAVLAALQSALSAVSPRDRALTLVVPDAAVRVLLLDFDTLPAKRQEALPVVRFRLRKMVPFDIEAASVSYQIMSQKAGQVSVLVTVMPGDVLAEYEGLARELEYEPGAVLPSTLAVAAGLGHSGSALLVNQSRFAVTTSVTMDDEMLLHRTVDLSRDQPLDSPARSEEMAQAVITTLAWYEDTLHSAPGVIFYAGPGGARAAAESPWFRFVEPAPPIEDISSAAASALTTIPDGLSAGVLGALAQ